MVPAALLPALTLIAGTAGGIAFQTSWRLLLWLLPALAIAASLAWRLRYPRATVSIIVIAFGCCGFILGSHAREAAIDTPVRLALDRELGGFRVDAADLPGTHGPIATRLLLTEDAASGEDFTTLRARVLSIRLHDTWTDSDGGVVLSVGGMASAARVAEWRRSRVVEAPVSFRRPARVLDEGVSDFERDAALDGISLLGSIKSGLLVDVVRRGTIVSELAADARAYVRRVVQQRVGSHGSLSAAIVSAVLIGDRSGLPDDIRTRLQAAGTYHVIAISGGNIAILAALIVASLVPIGVSGRRAAFVTLVLLVAYAGIVTAGPSVWRATLVAIVYLTSRLLDHRSAPWQAMAVAGVLLAVVEPLDVRNAGFILTFGATAALLEVARRGPVNIPGGPSNPVRRGRLRPRWLSVAGDIDDRIGGRRDRAAAGDGGNVFARDHRGSRAESRGGSRHGPRPDCRPRGRVRQRIRCDRRAWPDGWRISVQWRSSTAHGSSMSCRGWPFECPDRRLRSSHSTMSGSP